MIPPLAQRIAEVEEEIVYLRRILETEQDADVRNAAAKLLNLLAERLRSLRRQQP
jgi:hypothetical protein